MGRWLGRMEKWGMELRNLRRGTCQDIRNISEMGGTFPVTCSFYILTVLLETCESAGTKLKSLL